MSGQPWTVLNLTVSDLGVIALMVVVFILALLLPYPKAGGEGK